ncbi:hypothetical protein PRK78_002536 [Emydomyces testavorans]|uniref:Lysine-specific metallo-endopeptidase domain-containing protein n=1 Tax=Emydomyces testavorans TaxID=2070801 RepID=A0AAF0DEE6_9EURO|nr:hypothetical protein PRK78_002536 [Emydomyces testavorans]
MKLPMPSLPNSFTKLLVLGLSTQLVLGNGSFTLKISDCSMLEEGLIHNALESMKLAASVAEDRTRKLSDVLKRNPGSGDLIKGSDFSTLMFFETMFGQVDPCNRAQKVEDIHNDPDSEITDTRPAEWGGDEVNWVDSKDQLHPCKNPDVQAWSSTKLYAVPEPVDLTVVCDAVFQAGHMNDLNSKPYGTLRQTTFPTDSKSVDDIDDFNLATILTHEFSHSGIIYGPYGGTRILVDYEYGFKECAALARSDPSEAAKNAGLTLDKNDWSTGRSKPVPPDFHGPIDRLSWKNGKWEK